MVDITLDAVLLPTLNCVTVSKASIIVDDVFGTDVVVGLVVRPAFPVCTVCSRVVVLYVEVLVYCLDVIATSGLVALARVAVAGNRIHANDE